MSIKRGIFAALLALVVVSLFLTNSYAAGSINTISCITTSSTISVGDCIAGTLALSIIGIGISLVLVGVVYMAGEILNYDPLRGLYKKELWETAKSMIIIGIIFSTLIIASALAASFAGSTPQLNGGSASITSNLASIYSTVDTNYLVPQLNNSYATFGALMGLSVGSSFLRSVSLSTWFPIPIFTEAGIIGSVQFGSNTKIFQSNYLTALDTDPKTTQSIITLDTDIVITILLMLQMQHDLLYVIAAVGLGVFLPIGVIMRAMPFVRGIGGTMIAIGIGLAIVYPIILVGFNLPITNYIYSLTAPTPPPSTCPFSSYLLCQLWSAVSYVAQQPIQAAATAAATGTGLATGTIPVTLAFGASAASNLAIATASGSGFWIGVGGPFVNGIFPALNFVIDNSLMQIVQFILFVLDLIMAVAITNGIAGLMGGSLRLGVGKFKLA